MKQARPLFALVILGLVAFALTRAQGQAGTVMGAEGTLFGSKVSSWAKLDAKGAVQEVGVTLPMKTVEAAPVPKAGEAPPANMEGMMVMPDLRLEFPDVVKKTTFLDHLDLYWEKFGHPPARYLTPHFDLHFFGVPSAAVDKIDCKNLTPPGPDQTPKGYAPAVPPGVDPATMCVPMMGFHGLPLSEFSGPGELRSGLFDAVLISGFYEGKYTFTEPMITRAFLMTKKPFGGAVARPEVVGRSTMYPTKFNVSFDAATDAFNIVYGGFEAGK